MAVLNNYFSIVYKYKTVKYVKVRSEKGLVVNCYFSCIIFLPFKRKSLPCNLKYYYLTRFDHTKRQNNTHMMPNHASINKVKKLIGIKAHSGLTVTSYTIVSSFILEHRIILSFSLTSMAHDKERYLEYSKSHRFVT